MNCAIHTDVPAAAFCRTCGKALCDNCKREVMGAIYCEPCIAARLQGSASVPPATATAPVTALPGQPSPALATLLGFVPGVGAMYNGQFVKAFVHIVIFACLVWAAAHVSGLMGLLIGFFVFYMVFEAHQTAKAKQYGLPNPDFLGIENVFGVQENQPPPAQTAATQRTPQGQQPTAAAPTGAVILVALGIFFLLGNIGFFHARRMWPLVLIGFGLWIAYKRTAGRE